MICSKIGTAAMTITLVARNDRLLDEGYPKQGRDLSLNGRFSHSSGLAFFSVSPPPVCTGIIYG